MSQFWQRFWTIFLILLTEFGYILLGISVMSDVVNPSIPYDWITTRLILTGVSMLVTPIIISRVIYWIAQEDIS